MPCLCTELITTLLIQHQNHLYAAGAWSLPLASIYHHV